MKLQSHTNAKNEEQVILPCGQEILPLDSLSKKTLRIVDRKFMASHLGVHEATLSHWIAGSKPIPSERLFEIIKSGKFFCRAIRDFEDEIDAHLFQMGEP